MHKNTILLVVSWLLLMLPGCIEEPTATDEPTPTPAPSLSPSATVLPFLPTEETDLSIGRSEPTSAALAAEGELPADQRPQDVVLPTLESLPLQAIAPDNTMLNIIYYGAEQNPSPTIILLHDAGQTNQVWLALATELQIAGYDVFVPDMRGHGRSGGQVDWQQTIQDIPVIWQTIVQLGDVSTGQVVLIGAGNGADVALTGCVELVICQAVIAISPTTTDVPVAELGARGVLLVSADDDPDNVANTLNQQITGDRFWLRYSGGGRGMELFATQPDLTGKILEWLRLRVVP